MANNEKKDGNVFGGAVKTAEVKATEAKTTVKKTAKKAAAKTETAKKAVETAAVKAETKVEAKVEEAKETVKEAAKATTKKPSPHEAARVTGRKGKPSRKFFNWVSRAAGVRPCSSICTKSSFVNISETVYQSHSFSFSKIGATSTDARRSGR